MENNADSQLQYEKQVLFHLLIFRKAMEQYWKWGKVAIGSPRLYRDPQFQTGMEQLIQVIKTCGVRFQEISKPPERALAADRPLREMGKELENFSASLQSILGLTDSKKRKTQFKKLSTQSQMIKQRYHQFINSYEVIYPGRLSSTLGSFLDSETVETTG